MIQNDHVQRSERHKLIISAVSKSSRTVEELAALTGASAVTIRRDLADLADRHPLSLSGGQKQRLVIATAIDQDARVLILDEPTSGVDHRHLVAIAAELRDLAREGRVVIVISHDIEFLNECTDHVIEIE